MPNNLNQYKRTYAGTHMISAYKDDGDLLSDGDRTYTYNAENRLATMTDGSTNISFKYDYMGRRISKTIGDGAMATETRFMYDGWNLVAELAVDNKDLPAEALRPIRTYTWGLDVSGSMSGAGGVGGLLSMTDKFDADKTYYYRYDGNGNVVGLIDPADGTEVNSYDYSAFGKLVSRTETVENPFTFSTKYEDDETGLFYYGYRYYNAETGRWINRDPIEERGGLNIYGFIDNDGVNFLDFIGLWKDKPLVKKQAGKFTRYIKYLE